MKLVDLLTTCFDSDSEVEVRLCDGQDFHIVREGLTQRDFWPYLLNDVVAWTIERGHVLRIDVRVEVRYE